MVIANVIYNIATQAKASFANCIRIKMHGWHLIDKRKLLENLPEGDFVGVIFGTKMLKLKLKYTLKLIEKNGAHKQN